MTKPVLRGKTVLSQTATREVAETDALLGSRTLGNARSPVRPGGRRVRLDDAVTYFLGEWPSEGPTVDTLRSYAGQLKWLCGFAANLHKTQLADCTADIVRAAMAAKMNPNNRSLAFKGGESGAKALLAATRRCFSWLSEQGTPVPDLSTIKAPRVPERVQPRLQPEEFKAIEAAILRRLVSTNRRVPRLAIARDLALIYLLGDTGLRANEVCGMTVHSVDFSTGSVLIVRGKGKKQRALSIIDPEDSAGGLTLRLLEDWVTLRQEVRGAATNSMLWVSMKGNPLSRDALRKLLGKSCQEAGLATNRPPHTFRRANFTEHYRSDPSSIRVLAARMGWSDKSHHMIDVYTRGAEIELSRTTPVPSAASLWHEGTGQTQPPPLIRIDGVGSRRRAPNGPGTPTFKGDVSEAATRDSRGSPHQ